MNENQIEQKLKKIVENHGPLGRILEIRERRFNKSGFSAKSGKHFRNFGPQNSSNFGNNKNNSHESSRNSRKPDKNLNEPKICFKCFNKNKYARIHLKHECPAIRAENNGQTLTEEIPEQLEERLNQIAEVLEGDPGKVLFPDTDRYGKIYMVKSENAANFSPKIKALGQNKYNKRYNVGVNTLLDSQATVSVVSSSFLSKIDHSVIKARNTAYKDVSGNSLGNGLLANFTLKISNNTFLEVENALIIEKPIEEILLGQNVLSKYGFVINFGDRSVSSKILNFYQKNRTARIVRNKTYVATSSVNRLGPIRSIDTTKISSKFSDYQKSKVNRNFNRYAPLDRLQD